jgi:hypothetical protein
MMEPQAATAVLKGIDGDDKNKNTENVLGLVITALLICFSLGILLRMQYFAARRDCYVQGIHACPSINSGRSPHF